MKRTSMGALVLLATLVLSQAPAVSLAGDGDEDPARAAQIQEQAKEALDADQYVDAARLAARAVGLDPSLSTWLARQVRIEALEALGRYEEALTHIEEYLDLDGLFAEHRSWGKESRQRIRDALVAASAAGAAKAQRGAGVGLLVGGAAPLGVGLGFLANYGRLGGDFQTYGGWAQSGAVLLGVGVALEAVGLILVATAGPPAQSAGLEGEAAPQVSFDVRLGTSPRLGLTVRF